MSENIELRRLERSVGRSADTVDYIDHLLSSVYPLTPILQAHQNEDAYPRLVAAIGEITKTWEAVDNAFSSVWLSFNPKIDLYAELPALTKLTANALENQVREGRGHCHYVWEIYWHDLRPWFASELTNEQQKTLEAFFERVGNADMDVFRPMEELSADVEDVAESIIALVLDDKPDEARDVAKGLFTTVQPLREQINTSLSALKRFQRHFATLEPDDEQPTAPSLTFNVFGDHYTVGDIIGSNGIAIGANASANVVRVASVASSNVDELQQWVTVLETVLGKLAVRQPNEAEDVIEELTNLTEEAAKADSSAHRIEKYSGRLLTSVEAFADENPALVTVANEVVKLIRHAG